MNNSSKLLSLLLILTRSSIRRVVVDLQREIVVALCGVIIAGLFAYVFGDFLEQHIARISTTGRDRISAALAFCLVGVVPWFLARRARRTLTEPMGFAAVLHRVGEDPRTVRQLVLSWQILVAILAAGIMLWLVSSFLPSVATSTLAIILALLTIAVLLQAFTTSVQIANKLHPDNRYQTWNYSPRHSKIRSMLSWRLFQIVRRNPLIRWCVGLSLIAILGAATAAWTGSHHVIVMGFGLLAGLACSMIFPLQLQEDLRNSWAEKNAGVSHQDLIRVYNVMAQTSAAALAAVVFVVGLLQNSTDWLTWLQIGLASASFCSISPGLLFQIDARRPILQIAIGLLFGIFIATGIYVHLAAVILIPLLNYYTVQYQHGRYYRA